MTLDYLIEQMKVLIVGLEQLDGKGIRFCPHDWFVGTDGAIESVCLGGAWLLHIGAESLDPFEADLSPNQMEFALFCNNIWGALDRVETYALDDDEIEFEVPRIYDDWRGVYTVLENLEAIKALGSEPLGSKPLGSKP